MQFTFQAYLNLIDSIKKQGYVFKKYHDYKDEINPCILRHDIDISIAKALEFAEFERKICQVESTYFVLLSSELYNVFARENCDRLLKMAEMGHEIGLHFDETAYDSLDETALEYRICEERDFLEKKLGLKISAVSMHRPSKWVLDSNMKITGMINSYGKTFFEDFKYVSDSRMRFRENIEKYVNEKTYERLHILTHPFWYEEKEHSIQESLKSYLSKAQADRYSLLNQNVLNMSEVLPEETYEKSNTK